MTPVCKLSYLFINLSFLYSVSIDCDWPN